MKKVSMSILTGKCTVDSWSIGCVLMDILFKKHLFHGVESVKQLRDVLDHTGKRKAIGYCFIDYFKKKFPRKQPDVAGTCFVNIR